MRRFLALLLAAILVWNSLSAFVHVTQEVKASFLSLQATSLEGGQVLPVETPKPVSFFAIAYTSPEGLEYEFEMRYKHPDTQQWTSWEPVYTDHDMTIPGDGRQFSQIIFAPLTQSFEFRIPATTAVQASFSYLELITFSPENRLNVGFSPLEARALQDGFIVTREEWGADTKYLYDAEWTAEHNLLCKDKPWYCTPPSQASIEATQKKSKAVADAFPEDVKIEETITSANGHDLMWPVQKAAKINKLFVHHTANLNVDQNKDGVINRTDEEIAIRGIYYYHSIVRGWGDIGYNYIVGPTGTVYEGRFGGDKVVAAHAVWRNISSVGVSAMGNFESETVGDNEKTGIAKALGYLSKKHNLDPTGNTTFYGKNTPTIVGHRDSDEASTACPGKDLYAKLPELRTMAKDAMNGITVTPSGPLGSVTNPAFTSSYSPLQETAFAPGETKTLQIKLTNTGTETWDTNTYLAIQNADTAAYRIISGDKNPNKAAVVDGIVPAGDVGIFTLTIQSRYKGFTGNIRILPIAGGKFAMAAFNVPVAMKKGTVAFSNAKTTLQQTSYTFAEPIRGEVTLTNSGDVPWEKEGDSAAYIAIGASGADGVIAPLPTEGLLPRDVKPGETVSVPFEVLAPMREGTFKLGFTMRLRGDANLFGTSANASAAIVHPGEQTRLQLTINALASPDLITSIDTAGTYVIYVTNSGTTTWENLSMLEPDLAISAPLQGLTVSRGVFDERNLAPGKTTAVRFPFQTTYVSGKNQATFSLNLSGKTFVKGVLKNQNVQDRKISGELAQSTVIPANELVTISIKNTGDITWYVGKVRLALSSDASVALGGDKDIAPGNSATFQVRKDAISMSGTALSLLFEGRNDPVSVGTVTLRAAPVIPLEFGSDLSRFRLR